ncbi:MAG: VanZ family protein [Nitrospinae bacterium]|nr:VanZ family protein [Nitrospinota bacterium]
MQNKEKGRAWRFLIIYSLIIILTLPLMPLLLKFYYNNSSFPLSWVCYILSALLGIYIFVYLIFIKGEQRGIVYFWFILLSFISAFLILRQKLPAEKFHFIEYGFLSYFSYSAVEKSLEIGQLLHYTFVGLIVLIISSIDEFIQYLLPNRVGEFSDIFLNLISGVLGLMTIVLVLRRHEKWNFKFRGTHESG